MPLDRARSNRRGVASFGMLAGMVALCGCSLFAGGGTSPKLWQVEIGMTQSEVLAILGQPQRRETYGSTEFLIYSTDGRSNAALLNFTPIAIVDGRVTGIGRHLYDAVIRSTTADRDRVPP